VSILAQVAQGAVVPKPPAAGLRMGAEWDLESFEVNQEQCHQKSPAWAGGNDSICSQHSGPSLATLFTRSLTG
jgi:hypothetical protein